MPIRSAHSATGIVTLVMLTLAGCQSPLLQKGWGNRGRGAESAVSAESKLGTETDALSTADAAASPTGDSDGSADTTDPMALVEAGHRAAAEGRPEQARRYYEQALKADPTLTVAHHRLAILADLSGDYATAEKHYLEALKHPTSDTRLAADLRSDLGYSYLLQGRYAESEQALRDALRFDPKHAKALNNLGLLYARQNDYDRALAIFRLTGSEQEAQAKMARLFPNGRPLGGPTPAAGDPLAGVNNPPARSAMPTAWPGRNDLSAGPATPAAPSVAGDSPLGGTTASPAIRVPEGTSETTRRLKELMEQERLRSIAERNRRNAVPPTHTNAPPPVPQWPASDPGISTPGAGSATAGIPETNEQGRFPTAYADSHAPASTTYVSDDQLNAALARIDRRDPAMPGTGQAATSGAPAIIPDRPAPRIPAEAAPNRGDIVAPRGVDPLESMPTWPPSVPDTAGAGYPNDEQPADWPYRPPTGDANSAAGLPSASIPGYGAAATSANGAGIPSRVEDVPQWPDAPRTASSDPTAPNRFDNRVRPADYDAAGPSAVGHANHAGDALRRAALVGLEAGPGQLFPVVPSASGTAATAGQRPRSAPADPGAGYPAEIDRRPLPPSYGNGSAARRPAPFVGPQDAAGIRATPSPSALPVVTPATSGGTAPIHRHESTTYRSPPPTVPRTGQRFLDNSPHRETSSSEPIEDPLSAYEEQLRRHSEEYEAMLRSLRSEARRVHNGSLIPNATSPGGSPR